MLSASSHNLKAHSTLSASVPNLNHAMAHCASQLFRAAEALGGAVLFLDELDALATSRDRADTHEATRRVLGVLLREIDGFTGAPGGGVPAAVAAAAAAGSSGGGSSTAGSTRSVLIGATNRRQDLDAALLSRYGTCRTVEAARS
jgi:SpoVK/Ycf46/Vps4 family AAA+-type ATPase